MKKNQTRIKKVQDHEERHKDKRYKKAIQKKDFTIDKKKNFNEKFSGIQIIPLINCAKIGLS